MPDKKVTQNSPLLNLPPEIKLHVLSFLNAKDLSRTARACDELNKLSKDKSLPKVPDYENFSNSETIAEDVRIMTQSVDKRYLGILSWNSDFYLLDTISNEIHSPIKINDHNAYCNITLALTPDIKHLIITYHKPAYYSIEDTLYKKGYGCIDVWDLAKKKRICRYDDFSNNQIKDDPPCPLVNILSNEQFIVSLSNQYREINNIISSDGSALVLQTRSNKSIYVCDIKQKNQQVLDSGVEDNNGIYGAACISADKKLYARIINRDLNIHTLPNGNKIKTIALPKDIDNVCFDHIQFLTDNKTICFLGHKIELRQNANQMEETIHQPLAVKINSATSQTEVIRLISPKRSVHSSASFTILADNHIAALDNNHFKHNIFIYNLLTHELIKAIHTGVKTVLSSNDYSKMFILNDKDQLTTINFRLIPRFEKTQAQQQQVEASAPPSPSFRV